MAERQRLSSGCLLTLKLAKTKKAATVCCNNLFGRILQLGKLCQLLVAKRLLYQRRGYVRAGPNGL
jgi:hypothetical protein